MKQLAAIFCLVCLSMFAQAQTKPIKPVTDPETGCPINRGHITHLLRTVPADGRLYGIQRQAVGMHIDEVIKLMGGEEKAMAIAQATKQATQQMFDSDAYMTQAEKRFNYDTILRSNALIEILECRAARTRT